MSNRIVEVLVDTSPVAGAKAPYRGSQLMHRCKQRVCCRWSLLLPHALGDRLDHRTSRPKKAPLVRCAPSIPRYNPAISTNDWPLPLTCSSYPLCRPARKKAHALLRQALLCVIDQWGHMVLGTRRVAFREDAINLGTRWVII